LAGGCSDAFGRVRARFIDRRLIEVRLEPAAFMTDHKFKIGQWVSYGPLGERRIVYTILQKLPSESDGKHRYRIKAAGEPHERIVTEAELRDASHLDKS
jgi:hypothetical protein